MSAPSRFVREAMQRATTDGLCPVCRAKLRGRNKLCPNRDDGRHGQLKLRPDVKTMVRQAIRKSQRKRF